MLPTLKIFTIGMALLLSFSTVGYAQYGQLPYTNQVSAGQANPMAGFGGYQQHNALSYRNAQRGQYGQAGSYGNYQQVTSADPVSQLYRENESRPLGGLFANGFTRTLTVLGGWNFLNSIEDLDSLFGGEPDLVLPGNSIESETGYAFSFAFGRRHNHRLRSEIELAIRENDTSLAFGQLGLDAPLGLLPSPDSSDDTIRAYSVMKNFIFGFDNASRFTPYVGAGLGWSYLDVEAPSVGIDEGTGAFSYQGIGGVATSLNKAAEFIVEYRFLGTSGVEVDGIATAFAYTAHNLFMGVKFEY